MTSEVDYYAEQEANEAYRAMVQEIADLYGTDATESAIERRVYKETDCGARIIFAHDGPLGVSLVSIVEGSDAEVGPYFVQYTDDGTFINRYSITVTQVENEAAALWHEANDESEDD